MFRGVHAIALDAKGRFMIPARFREELQENCEGCLVVTVDHQDPCLLLYPRPEWEAIERKLAALPTLHRQSRFLQRMLIGHAHDCELDGQGRVLLPDPLRQFARLEKQIVLLGQGKKFEIWDEATWNNKREEWLADEKAMEELGQSVPELNSLSF